MKTVVFEDRVIKGIETELERGTGSLKTIRALAAEVLKLCAAHPDALPIEAEIILIHKYPFLKKYLSGDLDNEIADDQEKKEAVLRKLIKKLN